MMTREDKPVGELDLIYKSVPISRTEGDRGGFEGYASVFHYLDDHGDIVAPGSYKSDISRFLSEGFIGGVNHDHKNPIGRPSVLFEDSHGLFVVATLTDTLFAQEARKLISEGIIQKMSIGVRPEHAKKLNTTQDVYAYWDSVGWTPSESEIARAKYLPTTRHGVHVLKRSRILEISPVPLPANDLANITRYKSVDSDPLVDVYARLDALEATLKSLTTVSATEADEFTEAIEGFRNFLGES